jgi:ATP-dependent DNA helicase RecG
MSVSLYRAMLLCYFIKSPRCKGPFSDSLNKLLSQVQDIAQNCDPPIKIIPRKYKNILIVEVREGTDKPYRCTSGFYNRVGPNSQKMKRDEIVEFVKSEGKVRFDEMVNRSFQKDDFDDEKFNRFLKLAGISSVLATDEILKNLHAAETQFDQCYYYNTAVLFFAKNLDHHFFHTTVTCALFKGRDKVTILDRKDFNADIVDNIDQAMIFLKRHLNLRYEFDGSPARIEIPEIPNEALREAVINAVIHRDYFEKGANVMVEIFDDRVEIVSPGGLPKGLKVENFGKESVLRNPNIANLMQRLDYIEKMGTGILRMQRMLSEAGLPPLKYEFSTFVHAVFYRFPESTAPVTVPVTAPVTAPVTVPVDEEQEQAILAFCASPKSREEIQEHLGLKNKSHFVTVILPPLLESGLLVRTIPDKPNSRMQKYVASKRETDMHLR